MESLLLRLLVAAAAGTIIGTISRHRVTARVFALICIGSALVAIISTQFFKMVELPWYSDPGRLSAQVLAALGFIGAGFIWISSDKEVKGLSQSAALWYTAILGMLIGGALSEIIVAVLIFALSLYWIGTVIITKWKY